MSDPPGRDGVEGGAAMNPEMYATSNRLPAR